MINKEYLKLIAGATDDSEIYLEISKSGRLPDFLDIVIREKNEYISRETSSTLHSIREMGIDTTQTVGNLERTAEKYLDENETGIRIDTPEFKAMVSEWLSNETREAYAFAQQNPNFAPMYLYMCIYSMFVMAENDSSVIAYSSYKTPESIKNYSLEEVAELNSMQDFVDTRVPEILRDYATSNSSWSKLSSSKILTYARKYGNSFNSAYYVENSNADCTNFASQCLKAGGLGMIYNTSDKTVNKIVSTTSRWFNFKNASTGKYGVSTSWIRVVDLYTFLSPHYSTYSSILRYNIKQKIAQGDLLQGSNIVGRYTHSVIASKKNGEWCYCAHSASRVDESLDTFFNGFYKYRAVLVC